MLQVGSNNTLEDRISFNLGDHRDTGLSIDDDDEGLGGPHEDR